MTRPLLEGIVRQRLVSMPNIDARQNFQVEGLVVSNDWRKVTGVKGRGKELYAELIVDATGRGTRSPEWLEVLGYPTPRKNVCR